MHTVLVNKDTFGLPQWLSGKEYACKAGDTGDADSTPGLGRSPGEGNGNPLQCSCLENPMDRGAWPATVQRFTKSQTRLSSGTHIPFYGRPGCWPPCAGFLELQRAEATLSCRVPASPCSGLSCCRARSLGTRDQYLWQTGLVALRQMKSSLTRD